MAFDVSVPTRVSANDGYEGEGKLWPFLMNRQWSQVFVLDTHHKPECGQRKRPDDNYCDPRPTCGAVIQDIVDIVSDMEEIDFLMPGMR